MPIFTKETTAEQAANQLRSQIEGKNVLITGINKTSLAAEAARVIALYAKTIIVAGRSPDRMREGIDVNSSKASVKFIHFDLLSLKSASSAATAIRALNIPIHVIICSAVPPLPRELTRTEEGYEAQFAGGHLAHFELVSRLLPALQAAASESFKPRVVSVSSDAHLRATIQDFEDPALLRKGTGYDRYRAYSVTKLANILFARQFSKLYDRTLGLQAVSVHPGAIRDTGTQTIFTDEEWAAAGLYNPDGSLAERGKLNVKSREQGPATIVVAAFDPALDSHPGVYLMNNEIVSSESNQLSALVSDDLAENVWAISEDLVGSKFGGGIGLPA